VVTVPLEFEPPKYAVVVNAIQERIENGTYPPGDAIPSETQLMAEFRISRPTVVRALGILQQTGWIDSQHGRGRFVRARPPQGPRQMPEHAVAMLEREETAEVKLLSVRAVVAPDRAAAALSVEPGTAVIARQRLVVADEIGPIELGTVYVPVELATGTAVGESAPIEGGVLRHLAKAKGVEFTHATERISARPASAEEAQLLQVGRRECLLSLLVTAYDRAGAPRLVVDVLVPTSRHELEDAFPID
jgi:GntR family transcriptional regulator